MHHLRVPTTRALSLVTTGEDVMRDMMYDGNRQLEQGAVVCRVAPSFIRFGSFQIHALMGDNETLESLVEHTIKNHFPEHNANDDDGIISWTKQIAKDTAIMVSHWMRVGFVHGVMNTDNMSIHGLTIDYGPYGWIEDYNPGWTPNTTDSSRRRYRFGSQPQIAAWNLARLLESLSPLMEEPDRLHEVLEFYIATYDEQNDSTWALKLGLGEFEESDGELVRELNELLQSVETDMTIFFRELCSITKPEVQGIHAAFYDADNIPIVPWNAWLEKWWQRVSGKPDRELMRNNNPKFVLRNWMVQLAIDAAEKGDYTICESMFEVLRTPYDEHEEYESEWYQKRPEWARNRVGCSMLSCSS
tara:strand:- start:625 stop:1701 length:1077 start_codon:yes stop_codon:yes gene_type:complete